EEASRTSKMTFSERGLTRNFLISPARRGFLNAAVASAILLALIGSLGADDKAPSQILGGNPAVRSRGASRDYDGRGRYAGRSGTSGSTTRLYDSRGRMTGRVEVSKDSTRGYTRTG